MENKIKKEVDYTYFLLALFFGIFGIHRFYRKDNVGGFVFLFTVGIFYIGWMYDVIDFWVKFVRNQPIYKLEVSGGTEEATKEAIKNVIIKDPPQLTYNKCYKVPKSYVVIDFETTGFSHTWNDIIEVGAVRFNNFEIVNQYSCLVKTSKTLSKEIQKITGLTNEILEAEGIDPKVAISGLVDFIGDDIIMAHNASFDMSFLLSKSRIFGLSEKEYTVFDTLTFARRWMKTPNHKLQTLKEFLNLKTESHRAIDDCITTGKVYEYCYQLAFKKYEGIELEIYEVIKDIASKNDLDSEMVKITSYAAGYTDVVYYYNVLRIKAGRRLYMLVDREESQILELNPDANVEIGTVSEKKRLRVFLNTVKDLYHYQSIIVDGCKEATETAHSDYSSFKLDGYFW